MAYTKSTFGDIQLSVAYRYGETALPDSGDDNRKFWINKGIEYCINQMKLRKTTNVVVASGEVALDDDFKVFTELRNSGNAPIALTPEKDYNAYSDSMLVCAVTGNYSIGHTLKVKVDGTYALTYEFFPAKMVDLTDICVIPDMEAVAAYAYAMLRKSETDPLEDAEINIREADNRIAEMNRDLGVNDGDLRFKPLF